MNGWKPTIAQLDMIYRFSGLIKTLASPSDLQETVENAVLAVAFI